ncbi:helix-turn-helix transcriptional regulator [Streptomyces sp. 7-21]|uniref:helix-turn-helix transcriptional regulator n=1 Tax=Streptomyces sp. 7-21 TaxID=2802283 RepID=UPI00191DBBFE|nr:helix-turn-helix transcriptional regulator [Streptomyces sp. 7-21]MBL1068497.1 helix-turn-helix transcriptional regulator [Streptomyces sp. 7-21]
MQEFGEIDARAAHVYRLRVIHPTDSVEQIAARAGLTPEEAADAESQLSALGLLRPSPSGGQVAVSPETAADTLLAPLEQEILERRISMAATRARLHALSGDYLEARSMRSAKTSIEVVEGTDNTRAVIDDLVRTCVESLDALVPGRGLSESAVKAATSNDLEMLERGVKMRSLFQHTARKNRLQVRHVGVLTAAGAQVRSTTVLPSRMQIYDRSCAVLPLDPSRSTGAGAAIIRDPTVLSFLQRLFEHYWDRAVDFTDEEPRSAPGPTEIEHDVLLLMAAGKKDEAIAHQLGMSPRSVSRIVARLMERLDAASRFQAGARAAMNGWLSDI